MFSQGEKMLQEGNKPLLLFFVSLFTILSHYAYFHKSCKIFLLPALN